MTPVPPSPWTAKDSRIHSADNQEILVATRTSSRWRAHTDDTARLASAAPQLLAFVERWLQETEGSIYISREETNDRVAEALLLIRKATGRGVVEVP